MREGSSLLPLVIAVAVMAVLVAMVISADIVAGEACAELGYDNGEYDSFSTADSRITCSYDALTITLPEIKDWYDEHTEVNHEQ